MIVLFYFSFFVGNSLFFPLEKNGLNQNKYCNVVEEIIVHTRSRNGSDQVLSLVILYFFIFFYLFSPSILFYLREFISSCMLNVSKPRTLALAIPTILRNIAL